MSKSKTDLEINIAVATILFPKETWSRYTKSLEYALSNKGNVFLFERGDCFVVMIQWMFKFVYEKIDGGDSHMLSFSEAMRMENSIESRRKVALLIIECNSYALSSDQRRLQANG